MITAIKADSEEGILVITICGYFGPNVINIRQLPRPISAQKSVSAR